MRASTKGLTPRTGLVLLAATLLVSVWLGPVAWAGITGSGHDFSDDGWTNNPNDEICLPCHIPHNALDVTDAPLWNHTLSTATYTLYDSPTFDATDISQPTGASKLCLSCHDGTVAVDAFSGQTGNEGPLTGAANLGTDLSDDHPISFTYDDTLATTDGELFAPSSTNSGLGSTIDDDMLFNGQMQCASCHDVHNTVAVAGTPLLLKDNANSALCLTCHDK